MLLADGDFAGPSIEPVCAAKRGCRDDLPSGPKTDCHCYQDPSYNDGDSVIHVFYMVWLPTIHPSTKFKLTYPTE